MIRFALLLLLASVANATDLDWTRFSGTVKSINLKASTITIQNKDGDLFTIPVDYQVKIIDGKAIKRLQDISLDNKVTLIRTPSEKPKEDMPDDLVPYKGK